MKPTRHPCTAVAQSCPPQPAPPQLPQLISTPSTVPAPLTPPTADAPPAGGRPQSMRKPAAEAVQHPGEAALRAAAAAAGSSKLLQSSVLLHQLLPLTSSLDVGLQLGDIHQVHAVLVLLQSVPMTGQLLYSSQVARPVRRLLQQQVQLQTQCMQQPQQQQLLQSAAALARQLLQRWKQVLVAELAATDPGQEARARQLLRAHHKLQQQHSKRSSLAPVARAPHAQPLQHTPGHTCSHPLDMPGNNHLPHTSQQQHRPYHISPHPPTTTPNQPKLSFMQWKRQQDEQHSRGHPLPSSPADAAKRRKLDSHPAVPPCSQHQHEQQHQQPAIQAISTPCPEAAAAASHAPCPHAHLPPATGPAAPPGPDASPLGGTTSSSLLGRSRSIASLVGAEGSAGPGLSGLGFELLCEGDAEGDACWLGRDGAAMDPAGGCGGCWAEVEEGDGAALLVESPASLAGLGPEAALVWAGGGAL